MDRVTVVIPTMNEADRIAPVVARLLVDGAAVVVADGGSGDGTAEVARDAGAAVVRCDPGRGVQMNAGAAVASGEGAIVFLHADTRLPGGWAAEVRRVLAMSGVAAGAFAFRLDRPGVGARAVEWGVALRCRWRRTPYGDQAIFLRRATFEQVGGYRPIPAMEDYDLVARLKKLGHVVTSPLPAVTSGRFYAGRGAIRATALNQACLVGYSVGVAPETIARWRGAAPIPEPTPKPLPHPKTSPCPTPPTDSTTSRPTSTPRAAASSTT